MTKEVVLLFPGQGSQYVGMGKDFYDNVPIARELFQQGNELLNSDITSICFNGPKESLNLTENTQPAILITSIIALKIFIENGIEIKAAAGHSLGEYSALVAAEALSFADAVPLVHLRGKLMQDAVPAGKGAMAAIIGLQKEEVRVLCDEIKEGLVQLANYNSPEQIVIAGEKEAVDKAIDLAKNTAKRVIPLPVSAPSHSSLMNPAQENLTKELKKIQFNDLKFPVVTNVDASPVIKADEAVSALGRQLTAPVRWEESMRYIVHQGIDTVIEMGPKKVLSGLMKRINKNIKCFHVEDVKSLKETLSELKN